MRQMQYRADAPDAAAERNHLCGAANVTTDSMFHHLLVKTARAMPKLAAREAEFAGAQTVVRIVTTVTQTAPQSDLCLTVLAPRNVPTLRGPKSVFIKLAVEQHVNRIESNGCVSVGADDPRRLRAANADVLRVVFQQLDVLVLADPFVNLRRHDVCTQAVKRFG